MNWKLLAYTLPVLLPSIAGGVWLLCLNIPGRASDDRLRSRKIWLRCFLTIQIFALFYIIPCFFLTNEAVLTCDKRTNVCVYERSTMINDTLREIERYDFSGAKHATVEKREHRRKRHDPIGTETGTRYVVGFPAGNRSVTIPDEFKTTEKAENVADDFNDFLKSENRRMYIYTKNPDMAKEDEILNDILFFTVLLFVAYPLAYFVIKQKRREEEKKNEDFTA